MFLFLANNDRQDAEKKINLIDSSKRGEAKKSARENIPVQNTRGML